MCTSRMELAQGPSGSSGQGITWVQDQSHHYTSRETVPLLRTVNLSKCCGRIGASSARAAVAHGCWDTAERVRHRMHTPQGLEKGRPAQAGLCRLLALLLGQLN